MRRVIVLTPDWPWPPTTGGRSRVSAIIDALRSSSDVTVLATDDPESVAPAEWRTACRRFAERHAARPARLADYVTGLLTGRHIALQRAIASGMPAAFSQIVREERPDVAILGLGFGGPFTAIAKRAGARVIVDAGESLVTYNRSIVASKAGLRARLRAALDLLAVRRMEARDFSAADAVWLANGDEVRSVAAAHPSAKVALIPNVAPPTTYEPPGPVNAVGFVGFYRHPPNEEAALYLADSVMPVVHARGGPQELRLIGRDPTEPVLDRAARHAWIVVTGEVPDPVGELRAAGVLAMPITSGGGTRMKAIEAAAAGVPIVSTAFGVSGLGLEAGRDFIRAESPAEFAEAILKLAEDSDLRVRLTDNARAAIDATHSRDALIRITAEALGGLPTQA